jgi:hypothetical protein
MGVDRDMSEISAENERFAGIRSRVAGQNGQSMTSSEGPGSKNLSNSNAIGVIDVEVCRLSRPRIGS